MRPGCNCRFGRSLYRSRSANAGATARHVRTGDCVSRTPRHDHRGSLRQPLVIGVGRGEQFLASDTSPLVGFTERIIYLADHQLAVLRPDSIQVIHRDEGRVRPDVQQLSSQSQDVDLGGFRHYMLKEIYEQPQSIRNALRAVASTRTMQQPSSAV